MYNDTLTYNNPYFNSFQIAPRLNSPRRDSNYGEGECAVSNKRDSDFDTEVNSRVVAIPRKPKANTKIVRIRGIVGVPQAPAHISKAIDEARYILNLSSNWDDDGAVKIPQFVFDRATDFLSKYSDALKNIYKFDFPVPAIQPLKDGSIDLEWDTNKGFLLINFKNTEEFIAYYYGEIKTGDKGKIDYNGEIKTEMVINTVLSWFKDLS